MARPDPRSRLRQEAIDVLATNDAGRFIKPGPRQYPGQWNWDAAFNVIGLAHFDPARAHQEVLSLLEGQWADGMLPHIVFHEPNVDYFPGPPVWGKTPAMPSVATSGITQPPLLTTAVSRLHAIAPDRSFLREVIDALELWHRWFHRDRLVRGLVQIHHPWESGMDNSPRWDGALSRVEASPRPLPRRDRVHVPPDQRPTDGEYGAYLSILDYLRGVRYRPPAGECPFRIGDVFVTSVLCRAEFDLADLWSGLGHSPASTLRRRETLRRGLERVWNDEVGLFVDDRGEVVPTIAGLLAAYGLPESRFTRCLAAGVSDPGTFGPSPQSPWYPTSVARHHPSFDPRRYWRGPVWVNINWLTARTLRRAGHIEAADRVRASTLELVAENGFWEYYCPETGEGLGSDRFSWTAALTIDLLAEANAG